MEEKRRAPSIKKTEIGGKEDIREIDHETVHPGEAEMSLQNADFAPGENTYLNDARQENVNE
ncbi:hypothetical protein ACFQ3N_04855 [Virgibacillus byunsanensis]|uniref:DUF4025 domain-containing protein n=1 Tax=Virgibacillus byunsanensis TaxID=570945 RepID=A0ABW3LJX7_9BACI